MTNQTDHVQSIIADIDRVLRKSPSWNPWRWFLRIRLQRKILERARSVLVSQQQAITAPRSPAAAMPPPLSQPLLSVVTQEIEQLRTRAIQPLQADITHLSRQRESLLQEVRALEQQKAALQAAASTLAAVELADVGRLQAMRDRTDHLLTSMDSSLHMTFSSLQRNLQTYQDSLSKSIDRMHGLGYQGEVMFSSLVTHLAEQLGREASSFLSSHPSTSDSNPAPSAAVPPVADVPPVAPEVPPVTPEASKVAQASEVSDVVSPKRRPAPEVLLPFPGMELAKGDRPAMNPQPKPPSPPPVARGTTQPASPAKPPKASTQVDTIHSLEDLLQEISGTSPSVMPSSPSAIESGTLDEAGLTLTGMDDLFAALPSPEPSSQVTMESLFDGSADRAKLPKEPQPESVPGRTPSQDKQNPSKPRSSQNAQGSANPANGDDPYSLTLDEIDRLFE